MLSLFLVQVAWLWKVLFWTTKVPGIGSATFDPRVVGVCMVRPECSFSAWFPLWKTNCVGDAAPSGKVQRSQSSRWMAASSSLIQDWIYTPGQACWSWAIIELNLLQILFLNIFSPLLIVLSFRCHTIWIIVQLNYYTLFFFFHRFVLQTWYDCVYTYNLFVNS